jgi:hypothetical protein
MNIEKGYQLDNPSLLVPWGINEGKLVELFGGHELKMIGDGYYTAQCNSLGGLDCYIGFHFTPRLGGTLSKLEFF